MTDAEIKRNHPGWMDKGHRWQTCEDGEMDYFAYEWGQYCNGPVCTKCGYEGCWHCIEDPPLCPVSD